MNITPELFGLNDAMEKQAYQESLTFLKVAPKLFKGLISSSKKSYLSRYINSIAYQRTANQLKHMAEMAQRRGMSKDMFVERIEDQLANRLERTSKALGKAGDDVLSAKTIRDFVSRRGLIFNDIGKAGDDALSAKPIRDFVSRRDLISDDALIGATANYMPERGVTSKYRAANNMIEDVLNGYKLL